MREKSNNTFESATQPRGQSRSREHQIRFLWKIDESAGGGGEESTRREAEWANEARLVAATCTMKVSMCSRAYARGTAGCNRVTGYTEGFVLRQPPRHARWLQSSAYLNLPVVAIRAICTEESASTRRQLRCCRKSNKHTRRPRAIFPSPFDHNPSGSWPTVVTFETGDVARFEFGVGSMPCGWIVCHNVVRHNGWRSVCNCAC